MITPQPAEEHSANDAIDQARRDWLTGSVYTAEQVSRMDAVRAEFEVSVHYPGGNGTFLRDRSR